MSITGKVQGSESKAMLQTMIQQRKHDDSRRRPNLTNIPLVRTELEGLLKDREEHGSNPNFERMMGEKYTYLSNNFPIFFKTAVDERKERLGEFKELADLTLDKIESVQKGTLSKEACTEELLDEEYAPRFYSKQ